MPGHLTDETVALFVRGTLSEHDATMAALHIDACPDCANRVLDRDPLSAWLAAVDDPLVLPSERERVLAAVAAPGAMAENAIRPWMGMVLLFVAASLFLLAGDPSGLARHVFTIGAAAGVGVASVLRAASNQSLLVFASALLFLASCLWAVRVLGLSRDNG
jgi:hypothetical protein